MLAALASYQGRQELFLRRRPEALDALRTVALVESSQSSNRLEGIAVPRARVERLVLKAAEMRNRSEQEVAVPQAMGVLMAEIRSALERGGNDELLWIPLALLDFLCIHPFTDGNGRVGRLLTLLLLYRSGWLLGRYISLEVSSQGWHEQRHDPLPWCRYLWGVLLRGYREFEQRIDALAELRQGEGLTVPRAEKRQLVREACLRQLVPFPVSSIEQECPGISRELIRQVLLQLAEVGLMKLEGRGRSARWVPLIAGGIGALR